MAYKLQKLDRPATGAGAPSMGSRFAYLALIKDLVSFPDTDENNVVLQGQPVFQDGKGLIPVYITTSSREVSYETNGDQDARAFKLKFVGAHPGTEREALEFATNMLDEEFIIFIPGCQASDPVKVLGRPCAPLVFKSSHKSGKDGSKFEFTFEQEVGGKNAYMLYFGSLNTLQVAYKSVDFSAAVTSLDAVQMVAKGNASPLNITALDGISAGQVTFIGQETDAAKAAVINEDLTAPILVIVKNGTPWKAVAGASITFEVIHTSNGVAVVERWRV